MSDSGTGLTLPERPVDPRDVRRDVDGDWDPLLGYLAALTNRRLNDLIVERGVEVLYL